MTPPLNAPSLLAASKQAVPLKRTLYIRHVPDEVAARLEKLAAQAGLPLSTFALQELTEAAPPANDFLADVCVEWEREALAAERAGVRVALARTGIVLGSGGGALAKMLTPFKLGAGGPLGNGRQWMPWVHVSDLARLYMHAAETAAIRGPMNAVAPHPVRNSEFTKALGRQLHRPAFMPAPYLGLRLLFGEFAKVLFASQRVIPKVATDTGFVFQYPDIASALREILAPAAA